MNIVWASVSAVYIIPTVICYTSHYGEASIILQFWWERRPPGGQEVFHGFLVRRKEFEEYARAFSPVTDARQHPHSFGFVHIY